MRPPLLWSMTGASMITPALELLLHRAPLALEAGPPQRQDDVALLRLRLEDVDEDGVADRERGLRLGVPAVELAVRDDAFALGADVDEDLVLVDPDDGPLDDVAVLEALDVRVLLGEQLLHRRRLRPQVARHGSGASSARPPPGRRRSRRRARGPRRRPVPRRAAPAAASRTTSSAATVSTMSATAPAAAASSTASTSATVSSTSPAASARRCGVGVVRRGGVGQSVELGRRGRLERRLVGFDLVDDVRHGVGGLGLLGGLDRGHGLGDVGGLVGDGDGYLGRLIGAAAVASASGAGPALLLFGQRMVSPVRIAPRESERPERRLRP